MKDSFIWLPKMAASGRSSPPRIPNARLPDSTSLDPLDRALYPGRAGRGDRASLERIGRDLPAGPEVARAVAAREAVDAAVTVAVSAGASGGHGGHGGH
jgi:hypothetical protein